LGVVEIKPAGNDVVVTLQPEIGAPYRQGEQTGRIVAADETTFDVDFNPALAGETVIVELEVVNIVKASAFKEDIRWLADHDQGLQKSAETAKPVVLVLYADWCGWSQRLLKDTLTDPRIKLLKDQFIWVKVNSDREITLKERYDQVGYPLVVLLDPGGQVVGRIDGFRDAAALKAELEQLI
jgi:thiol:disulfide interchange protein